MHLLQSEIIGGSVIMVVLGIGILITALILLFSLRSALKNRPENNLNEEAYSNNLLIEKEHNEKAANNLFLKLFLALLLVLFLIAIVLKDNS